MSTAEKATVDISQLKGPEALFKTDAKLEQQGIWLDYGDFRIKVARAGPGNKRFKTLLDARLKPHRRSMANDTMNDDVADKITKEVWAETIILGWDSALGMGIIPYKGQAFQFSVENCKTLFVELPDLFTDVREQSMKQSLFLADATSDAGN